MLWHILAHTGASKITEISRFRVRFNSPTLSANFLMMHQIAQQLMHGVPPFMAVRQKGESENGPMSRVRAGICGATAQDALRPVRMRLLRQW